MSYLQTAATPRRTLQSEAIPGREQVKNAAGGFGWKVGSIERLRRFLVLGSEGGTYYATERDLTSENTSAIHDALGEHGIAAVAEIAAVSVAGRAPKPDPAIYALAIACAHKDDETRKAAIAAIPKVCRTGTHLFTFLSLVEGQRGWGRALKNGVAAWYEQDAEKLAYQMVKYRQRGGWSHRDALRLSHPLAPTRLHADLYDWACGRDANPMSDYVAAFKAAQSVQTPRETVGLIEHYADKLPREAIQTAHLADPKVMEALLAVGMPMTALIRNLATLTRLGVIAPLSAGTKMATDQLADENRMKGARVHPLSVLVAMATYASGQSLRGDALWQPVAQIVDGLDDAFYASFVHVEPTGKRHLIGIDLSGSMGSAMGGTPLSCRAAASAMAMTVARVEEQHAIVGFTGEGDGAWVSPNGSPYMRGRYSNITDPGVCPIPISPRQRLDDVMRATSSQNFGPTDCALPMLYALEKGIDVDVFMVLTDNETWCGDIHPAQALKVYRERTGINAKLVVVAMTSTGFTIADPNDVGMLDVVGFDTVAPQVIADFATAQDVPYNKKAPALA